MHTYTIQVAPDSVFVGLTLSKYTTHDERLRSDHKMAALEPDSQTKDTPEMNQYHIEETPAYA